LQAEGVSKSLQVVGFEPLTSYLEGEHFTTCARVFSHRRVYVSKEQQG